MYNIKTLRGTIFCPPIKYTKEFVASLGDLGEGYLPVLVRDNGALPVLPIWQISSPDEKEMILFNGEKIDVVQIVEGEIDDDAIRTFSERCKDLFSRILGTTGYPCTRIALAPSVIVTEKGVNSAPLYNRVFAVREFQHTNMDSSNLSQVYRVNKVIGSNNILVNHVVNFHAESELVTVSNINQIRERYMGDFDINTMVNPAYKFSVDDVKAFFDMATANFAEFYNLYFGE